MSRALIVVDMQKDFIEGALGTKEAKVIVPRVKEKIRGFDGIVLATMDTHGTDYKNTQEGRKLPVAHCIKGSGGWELEPEIDLLLKEKQARIFEKSSFGSVELAQYLAEINEKEPLEEIELVGLCTDICVISNAMLIKAFLPEVPVLADSGCCAGVTPESHINALEAMKMCQITVE
ncbi:cysteine hydrolase family protein [Qiania dongpingensis]|uniref:nicotinamidase n=1 Tax=Qiania dongpingensis TaxID=2763669 RepID=A0A7G9G662_9FIRM|nr:isochorismatase family cysteine hydrolase [Qiania dongpingensis]QNM06294.1 cysteine hydrolase [Qiania dongpingensis]